MIVRVYLHLFLRSCFRKPRKEEVFLLKICAADSMSLSVLVVTQLFSKVQSRTLEVPARKQNLT